MGELLKQFDEKPPASTLTIPAHFHEAIKSVAPRQR
jgi:hypothetical protein